MPGYEPDYQGLPYDRSKALAALQSAYPDPQKVPPITFSFPNSQVAQAEASALQEMWQSALGIQQNLQPVELNAYNNETTNRQVQFGFIEWTADFPDPYDWLALTLLSTATNNSGSWTNPQFDQLVNQAEQAAGDSRLRFYNQAQQIAITDLGCLPLDPPSTAAIIPPSVHSLYPN